MLRPATCTSPGLATGARSNRVALRGAVHRAALGRRAAGRMGSYARPDCGRTVARPALQYAALRRRRVRPAGRRPTRRCCSRLRHRRVVVCAVARGRSRRAVAYRGCDSTSAHAQPWSVVGPWPHRLLRRLGHACSRRRQRLPVLAQPRPAWRARPWRARSLFVCQLAPRMRRTTTLPTCQLSMLNHTACGTSVTRFIITLRFWMCL